MRSLLGNRAGLAALAAALTMALVPRLAHADPTVPECLAANGDRVHAGGPARVRRIGGSRTVLAIASDSLGLSDPRRRSKTSSH
jgi:hypothetical protein